MASLINIIRKQNPGNTLYLDAGDQFEGTLESSPWISHGRLINAFFDSIGLDASTIGDQ